MVGQAHLLLFGQSEEGEIGELLAAVSIINAIVFEYIAKDLDLIYEAYVYSCLSQSH
jgi:hypothetical protein